MEKKTIIENLEKLTRELGRVPSKNDVNNCQYLPSFNTINRRGISLSGDWLRLVIYTENPKHCLLCGKILKFESRENTFCNRVCSTTHNNTLRGQVNVSYEIACKCCSNIFVTRNKDAVFCSISCQQRDLYNKNVERWLLGLDNGWKGKTKQLKNFVRKYIYESCGSACSICGWDERHPSDGAILTEIDHIDGNAANCSPNNLRVLCPNCHSMTPTFRARNKISARER